MSGEKISNPKITKRKSRIHGWGIFTVQPLKRNEHVVDYYGEEMSWKAFTAKYGPYKTNPKQTYPMRRIWRIIVAREEPYRTRNVVNWINEGEKPNVILRKRALYALRDIPAHTCFFATPRTIIGRG